MGKALGTVFHPEGSPSPAALQVDGVRHAFGSERGSAAEPVIILDALALSPGAALAITGPSGAGKSTLLYLLAGLLAAQVGSIRWGAVDVSTLRGAAGDGWRLRQFGFVFQDFHLVPELTALENVLLPAWFGAWRASGALRARAAMLLEEFGVPSGRRPVRSLSRGEQQRVALARALLFAPPVILADEPTASLDGEAARHIAEHLFAFNAAGHTLIVVSHDPALIERAPQRLHVIRGQPAVLEHGREIAA